MIKIAIVESNKEATQKIKDLIAKYEIQLGIAFDVKTFLHSEVFISNFRPIYDVIFFGLDETTKNLDACSIIRNSDDKVFIILMADTAEFAIDGYHVRASGYLLRPIHTSDFRMTFLPLCHAIEKDKKGFLLLPSESGQKRIDFTEVIYVESLNHKLLFHTKDEVYQLSGSIKDIQTRLPEETFSRCHNSYLVNLNYVKQIDDNVAIVNKERIPISRAKRRTFVSAWKTANSSRR